ncbi:MAG: L-threonylcarbamoyladenylate synthase [Thermoleophilia bacterium]
MREWAAIVDRTLAGGEIGLLPTDTVYGLAAALDSEDGIAALYALKGRPRSQPCQVLVYHPHRLDEALAPLDVRTRDAARALLPGPATCLVPDPAGRFAAASGDAPGAVGVRAPLVDGPLAEIGLFLVATSANDPGGPDPARLDQVPARIRDAVTLQIDAGELPGTASAVVDLREVAGGGPARLLRPGPDPEAVAGALAPLGIAVVHPG